MKNRKNSKNILIVGAGIAGLECSKTLSMLGYSIDLIEKRDIIGGHLNDWHKLFPLFENASDVLKNLKPNLSKQNIHLNSTVLETKKLSDKFVSKISDGSIVESDAVIVSTGFEMFNAAKKEEYGYNVYDHVITSSDLEKYFDKGENPHLKDKSANYKIGFVHCVGSRDEKICNRHCSKVCCVTAVKQAIEIKKLYPNSEIHLFYMDLRMFGRYYEDLYFEAQNKYGIRFIRGRISEVAENMDLRVIVKAEDTLLSKPFKESLDLLVLMSGMRNSENSDTISMIFNLPIDEDGWFTDRDLSKPNLKAENDGVFITGTATGPKTIPETLNDARSTALRVHDFLR